nr:UPF0145 protein DehaBAV1_1363-like [Nerophis lumbriciformis]
MILTTTEKVAGKKIVRTLGLARGLSIRGRHAGKDIVAILRGVVGGEIHEYTKMMAECREEALDRMIEEAEELGANAVVAVRFATAEAMRSAAELMAYGTAVVIEDEAATDD